METVRVVKRDRRKHTGFSILHKLISANLKLFVYYHFSCYGLKFSNPKILSAIHLVIIRDVNG